MPGYICGQGAPFVRAREMGLEGIVSKRVGSAYWSGNCRNCTRAKNPSFARLALHEKRGVNIAARRKASAFAPGKTTARKALLRHGRGRRYHIG